MIREAGRRARAAAARTAVAVVAPAAVATLLVGAGCAGTSEPPRLAPRVERPTLAPLGHALSAGLAEPPPALTLEPRPFPEPPRPWFFPDISVLPSKPREGDVLALRIPAAGGGAAIEDVRGEIAGHPIRFARVGDGWLGIAPLPPGESGPATVRLRYLRRRGHPVEDARYVRIAQREYPSSRLSVAPRYSRPPDEVLSRIREERELVRETLSEVSPRWLAEEGFRWPRRSRVTSPFGVRRVFNGELRSRHWGVDLAGGAGAPVVAAARGRVALVRSLYFAGNAVYLDHGLGVYTAYFHLSEASVREGDLVRKGDLVGRVGATGRVTGPHLHWSLYVNGVHLDARSLLQLDLSGAEAGTAGAR